MSAAMLRAYVGEKRVGTLLYEEYAYQFRYEDPASLDAQRDLVSLTMPVRHRSYDTQVMPPPFQSVLPEGDLLIRLRARFGIGGAQPKALVAVGAAPGTLPTERFIIKMAGADFPMLPVNEHFCLEASRAAQIPQSPLSSATITRCGG